MCGGLHRLTKRGLGRRETQFDPSLPATTQVDARTLVKRSAKTRISRSRPGLSLIGGGGVQPLKAKHVLKVMGWHAGPPRQDLAFSTVFLAGGYGDDHSYSHTRQLRAAAIAVVW